MHYSYTPTHARNRGSTVNGFEYENPYLGLEGHARGSTLLDDVCESVRENERSV
jgi:hypothetical protein